MNRWYFKARLFLSPPELHRWPKNNDYDGVYGARYAVPGVSRSEFNCMTEIFPSSANVSTIILYNNIFFKQVVIIRIVSRKLFDFDSLVNISWRDKTCKKSEAYFESSVSPRIYRFINTSFPLPFPFLYRRSEARSNPSPKCWVVCTHIRGCIVLFLVAATEKNHH